MAVTQEFIEQVAEALNVLGDALENSAGYARGAEVISDEEEISNTLSLPAVLYDSDPIQYENAKALRYVQIPWSILSVVIGDLRTALQNANQAIEDVQSATQAANTAVESITEITTEETVRVRNEEMRETAESNRADMFRAMQNDIVNLSSLANDAADYANEQGDYAQNIASHPMYVADGTEAHPGDEGFLYQWDNDLKEYVKGQLISGTSITVATAEVCRSIIQELI